MPILENENIFISCYYIFLIFNQINSAKNRDMSSFLFESLHQ